MKIYMDACCLNRPFDDQSQDRVRIEAEAVLSILDYCASGEWELASSKALDFELAQCPDPDGRRPADTSGDSPGPERMLIVHQWGAAIASSYEFARSMISKLGRRLNGGRGCPSSRVSGWLRRKIRACREMDPMVAFRLELAAHPESPA